MSETAAQKQVRAHGGCGELLNDGRDICILQAGHGAHAEPSDRDKIIAKVAERLQGATVDPIPGPSGGYRISEDDATALATAAFDALVEAWGPPW